MSFLGNGVGRSTIVAGQIAPAAVGYSQLDSTATTPFSGYKNKIINGTFDFWQRGTSGSPIGGSQTGYNVYGYLADRWWTQLYGGSSASGNGTLSISRQAFTLGQTEVPNEPKYFQRLQATALPTQGGTGSAIRLHQAVEGVRTLSSGKATLSFYAKGDSSRPVAVIVARMFGTGGSPSVNQTLGQASINLTTSWTKFTLTFDVPSLSGKVLGSNGDDSIAVAFLSYKQDNTIYNDTLGAVGSWSTSAYLDVAQVQLEEGTVASQFEYRPTTIEMHLCQRYYQVARFFFGTGLASNYGGHSMLLPVTMRTNPSVAYTDDVGAVNKITTNGGGNGQTITGGSIGAAQYYMTFDLLYSGTTGNWVAGFVQLSADL